MMNLNENTPKKKKSHKAFWVIVCVLVTLIVLCMVSGPDTPMYRFAYNTFFKQKNSGVIVGSEESGGTDSKTIAEIINKGKEAQKIKEEAKKKADARIAKDENGYTPSDYRTAVNKSAYAFYHRNIWLQYSNRKMMHASPENATAGHTVYSSCTTFANQVYYDVFGIELPSDGTKLNEMAKMVWNKKKELNVYTETKDGPIGKYVVRYYEKDEFENTDVNTIAKQIAPYLKKGDVYNYHKAGDNFSHTMIVTGIEKGDVPIIHLIESNGADYNYGSMEDNYESSNNGTIGTIRTLTFNERFDPNSFENITFVRYVTDDFSYLYYDEINQKVEKKKLSLSASGLGRLRAQDIYIEKNASALTNSNIPASNMDGVDNSIVVFKIRLVRRADINYKNVTVSEHIDKNATVIKAECLENCGALDNGLNAYPISDDGKNVQWIFDMNKDAADTILLSYTIKVTGPIGSDIVSTGDVNGIRNATYVYHVRRQLTPTEKGKLINRYNEEKNLPNTSMTELIKKVYASSGANLNLSYLNNLSVFSVLENDKTKVQINGNGKRIDATTKINNSQIQAVTLNNFYGLRVCSKGHQDGGASHTDPNGKEYKRVFEGTIWNQDSTPTEEFQERAREIKLDQLQVGDLIYRYTEYDGQKMKNKIYLYLGNNTYCGSTKCKGFATIENGKIVEVTGADAGKLVRDIVYDYYIVMRPALVRN